MKQLKSLVFLLLATVVAFTSCDDKENETGITGQNWTEGAELQISTAKDVTIRFTAYGKWTATVTPSAGWCKLSATSGGKGSQSIIASVTGETTADRTATVTITSGSGASSFKLTQKAAEATKDAAVNRKVDDFMNKYYLWNGEYKSLKKDFNQDYQEFFYGNLYSMRTNTLDKRPNANGTYNLFSYIYKLPASTDTRAIAKELEYSFGITGITAVSISSQNNYYFCVQGVYPDSPASEAGLKRGAMISLINGNKITDSNINEYYFNLWLPDASISYTLTEDVIENGMITGTKEYPLTAKAMYANPVIFSKIYDEYEGHRIGYLVYAGFDAGFDEELFDVFKEFKEKNVTDLILDLRYNGGGHVMSANLIASCVAGSSCRDQVFAQYRYNEERMEQIGNTKPKELFQYDKYANLQTSLAAGDLSLKRLYCLVGNGTASASELVINSLRGIGIEVTLIGKKTTGKNVGMESVDMKIDDDTYRVAPITFQSYNAKDEGDYENGFEPDIEANEADSDGDGYFDNYQEYGSLTEPLFACAIREITGKQPICTRSLNPKRNFGKPRKMPALFRPGHGGMLKPFQAVEE